MDTAHLQSTFLGWIIPLAISISVLLRRNKDLRQKLFVLLAGNVTLYYFFSFLFLWQGDPWFEQAALGVAVLLPQGGLRFFRSFSSSDSRGMGRLGRMAAVLGVLLLAAVAITTRPAVGPAILAYVVGFMLVAILNLNVQSKEAATQIDALRIRNLVIGGLLVLIFQVLDRINHVVDVEMPPLGLAATLIYLYIISQTIIRYRVFDLYEMMGRFAVLTLMGIALAMIYTGLVFWAGRAVSISAFLASLVILIMLDPLREFVEQKISEFFFRERQFLEQEISALRQRLAHVIDLRVMVDVLMDGFGHSRRLTHASLYLIDAHGRGFEINGHIGPKPELTRIEIAAARKHLTPFASGKNLITATISQKRERQLQERQTDKAQESQETLALLAELNADALILIMGEELHGFISLRDERLKDPFSPEEITLLMGLADQVAITVDNSRLYQQTKERDRLAALGNMAAGLAHEIRNPLGSIKGAAQFIEEIGSSDGPEGELITVIVEEVDRLNRVVSDFLTYAKPASGRPRILDANDVLKRTLQVFEAGDENHVDLVVDLSDDLPSVEIDGERLHQVYLNLILNAVQALQDQQLRKLDISTRVRTVRSLRGGPQGPIEPNRFVEVRFADNGPGIDPETAGSIFIPFFTTKESGSGLGLALCQRLVRDAGGEIEVRSQPGQGSIFTVVLPVYKESDRESQV